MNEDLSQVPQMLALYKEVEAYFYGDEHVAGLKDWDELDGVICMLCEDNFGHMRTLPTPEIRDHKGGFGMYYHFDYHGGLLRVGGFHPHVKDLGADVHRL